MFDGADLSVVYGSSGGGYYDNPAFSSQQQPPQQPTGPMPDLTTPRSASGVSSHAMPPEPPFQPPQAMYAQQSPQATGGMLIPQETFWDRLSQKRIEVAKLALLALVVLFAISLDRFTTHYLSSYVAKAFLSETQEMMVRAAYPVAVITIIWIVKAL